jgi:CheY-like chemotaxis protein
MLLVDDNREFRTELRLLLGDYGIEVVAEGF